MHIIRGLVNLKPFAEGCVVTIGNFDGVHHGHRKVIENLAGHGRQLGLPVTVILFEPQPVEYFLSGKAPSRLTRLREKMIHLAKLPVDFVIVLRFDRNLANLEPENFIRQILVQGLGTKYLVVGDDFRFGRKRVGDFSLLQSVGQKQGFAVKSTQSFQLDNQRVSSTLIRHALESGDLNRAQLFLGRRYSVCGRVIEGAKRGRSIGFPTANIEMFRKNTPVKGVFAVTMTGVGDGEIAGVANIGTRPTVGDQTVLLEVHLFDFNADIYGHYVEIHFWNKIRDERRFNSLEELKKQIHKDVVVAQRRLQQPDQPN